MAVSCSRCGGEVRPPDATSRHWRCDACGPVAPLYLPDEIDSRVLADAVSHFNQRPDPFPLWCLWPLPPDWQITGVGWAGDPESAEGVRASLLISAGPAPLSGEPVELALVAEAPGVGLAGRLTGMAGLDPGPLLAEAMTAAPAHTRSRVGGPPTLLWSVPAGPDRSAYVGEAFGIWLVAVARPASGGYLFADDELTLRDLSEWLPPELPFGQRSGRWPG